MLLDSTLFADIADAIGLSNPTIVEKGYNVVQLLQLLQQLGAVDLCLNFIRKR